MAEETQLDKLKKRIPFSTYFENQEQYETILNDLLEDSKNIALANLYPFLDWSEIELPKKYYNWQLRACLQIKNALGYEGLKSYSENGLRFSRGSDSLLSNELMEELISRVGTLKTSDSKFNQTEEWQYNAETETLEEI